VVEEVLRPPLRRGLARGAALLAAALEAALPPGGPARAEERLRVVFVTHGQAGDPYWSVVQNGSAQAARDYGADVQVRSPESFDVSAMARLVDAAVASRPDGLAVSIPDAEALGPSIRAAVAAGIPVIAIDSGLATWEKVGASAYLGQDGYGAGLAVGSRLAAAGATQILCIHHEVGNLELDDRCRGTRDGSGAEVVVLPVPTDPREVESRVAGALQQRREIDALLALGPLGAIPMLEAVDELDARSRLKAMATFDLTPEVLERVADGTLLFATDAQQFLQGYLPVLSFHLHRLTGVLPTGVWRTGPRFVTKELAPGVLELSRRGLR
jgi:simple sugar transport system substrate-binding protein